MTNEEAIKTLEANYPDACFEQLREAVDAAIEALKAQDADSDTISRKATIDAILAVTGNSSVRELYEHVQEHGLSDMWSGGVNAAIDIIIAVPSVQPERKKGKWIYGESEAGNDGYYCSKCGNFVPWKYDEYDIDFIKEFLFCNKCGADMRTPVETARNIVHEAINNSVWSDTVDTAKMHKVVDDKYAEIRG